MKVLFLIDSLEGYGAEKSLVQIALNLKKVSPVFVHLYEGDKLKSLLVENGIKVYSLNFKNNTGHNKILKRLYSILKEEKPEIIHSTLFRADMMARKIKKRCPKIILVGSFVSNSYGKQRYNNLSLLSKLKLFTTQIRDRISAGRVDFFISNSKAIVKNNIHALGVKEDKVKIIFRGRSIEGNKRSQNNIIALKDKWKTNNKKVFLNIGRLQKGKGQSDLLTAFKKVNNDFPETVLIIIGEGPFRDQLQDLIRELKLEDSVFLPGYIDDVPELLAIADFFIFPSYFEGLPGALIEAIIAKKPSIVSDIEENRECLPRASALFFEPGNITELSLRMEEALTIDNWNQKTEHAYKYAMQNFNIVDISREYDEFYEKILRHQGF